jgi:hypothetical protein
MKYRFRKIYSFFLLVSLSMLPGCKTNSDTSCPSPKQGDYCVFGVPGSHCTDQALKLVCKDGTLVCPENSIPISQCASTGGKLSPPDGGVLDAPKATQDTSSSDTACPNPKLADYCFGGVPEGNCSDIALNPICDDGKLTCPAGTVPMSQCASFGGVVRPLDGGTLD